MCISAIASGVLSIGGALLGSNAQKKAADKAADTAAANNAANNALALDIYNRNTANFNQYLGSGARANSALDELIYGPQPAAPTPSAFAAYAPTGAGRAFSAFGGEPYASFGGQPRMMPQPITAETTQYGSPVYAGAPATVPATAQPSARSAFDNYLNSTGYQFRFNEGMKGLNIGFGAAGMLESGARDKAAIRFGQGIASDEFANYLRLLDNQQRLGFGGASALAGVGQNYAGLVTANNNAGADALANAALAKGAANASMWGSLGNSLGTAIGALSSSYGRKGF